MNDQAVAPPTDPFAEVAADPTQEPTNLPEGTPADAIEPTTDESLGGFDLPAADLPAEPEGDSADPAAEPEPAEVETPVEELGRVLEETKPYEPEPEPETTPPEPDLDGAQTTAAIASQPSAEVPVAPEPEPTAPEPEPPDAANGTSRKRTYLCFEEIEVKGQKAWVQQTEVEARNGDNALRAAYRIVSEEKGYEERKLVVVAERMFRPKTIRTRERRTAPAIEMD